MRITPAYVTRVCLLAAGLLGSSHAAAADLSWDGTATDAGATLGGAGTWNLATANWWNGTGYVAWANANNDTAILDGTGATVTLGTGVTAGSVTFAAGATGYTLAGSTLTLNATSAGATTITANESATINSGIALSGNTQRFTVAAGKSLTFGGVISGSQALTFAGSGSYVIGGINTNSANVTIDGATVTVNSGATLFAATGGWAGRSVTLQNGGTVRAPNFANGSGNFWGQIGDGSSNVIFGSGGGTFELTGASMDGTVNKGFDVQANNTGTFKLASGTVAWTGENTSRDFNSQSGATLVFDIGGDFTTSRELRGAGGFTKGGAGTMTLNGNANSFTGTLTVNAGTLVAAVATTGGTASATGNGNAIVINGGTLKYTGSRGAGYHQGAVTLNGGTLTFDAADMSFAVGRAVTFAGAATVNGTGQWRLRGGNTIVVNAAGSGSAISVAELNLLDGTASFNVADGSQAADLTVSSQLTGASPLSKSGSGRLVLSSTAAASDVGAITISAGTLEISGQIGAGTTGAYGRAISNSGALLVSSASNQTLSGAISGGGSLTKSGNGTLTLSGTNTFSGRLLANGGVVQLTAGSWNGGTNGTQGALEVASAAGTTGEFRVTGGVLNLTGATVAGVAGGSASNGMRIGNLGNGTFSQSGGTVAVGGSAALELGGLWIADGAGTTGALNLSGGTFTATDFTTVAGTRGTATVTVSGTANATLSTLQLGHVASGGSSVATVNLDGGTLTVDTITRASGTGRLYLNGGTLRARSNNAAFVDSSLTSAEIKSGGAFVDTNGYSVTIAEALVPFTGSTAGLTKSGAGVLTLSAANTYTGATAVSNGTLNVTGSLAAASAVSVASGGTLAGSGTVAGDVTVANGGAVGVGSSGSGTLTLGSLALGASAGNTSTLSFGVASASVSSALAITGGLVANGGSESVSLAFGANLFTLATGNYTLINYGGAQLADLSAFKVTGTRGGRQGIDLVNGTKSIVLQVSSAYPIWKGSDTDLSGAAAFALSSGGADTAFQAADTALFDDTAAAGTVNLTADVAPALLTFANDTLAYALGSSGGFKVTAGALIKSGAAALTVNTANTYAGGTTISGGTLTVGADEALGSGAIALEGGALALGGRTLSNAITLAGGSISGSGTLGGILSETGGARSLTVANGATLTLGGANTYTGLTTISTGGTLNLAGSIQGQVSNAGTFEVRAAFSGNVSNTGTVRFNRATAGTYAGVISGTGGLTVTGNGKITLTGANTYTGATLVQSGAALTIGDGSGSGSVGNTAITNNGALEILAGSSGTASVGAAGALTGTGAFAASGRKVHLYSDITQSGAVTLTQLGAGGNYQDAIELKKAGTTTITAGSIALSGDVGKDLSDGNTLALDTSAANGTIDLDISLGRAGVMYIPTGFTANAGSGAINVTGTGMADTGWRLTPVRLTGGAITVSAAVNTNATLTIANSAASTISGALSGSGALTKQGSGTLTISAVGSRSGALTVSEGTLAIAVGTTGAANGNSSGLGNGGNAITVASGARLHFTGGNSRTAGYHSGAVAINGGRITFDTSDNSFAAGNTLTFDVAAGTIDGSGQWRMRDGSNRVVVTAAASGSVISVADLRLTTSGGNHTFDVDDGGSAADLTISGAINSFFGGERLTKVGAGTLVLSGAASVDGGLTISAGTLQVGAGGTTGSVAGSIANNSILVFNRSDDLTHGSLISGSGQLSKVGDGVLTLTGANTFSGGTAVSTGTLRVGHLAALGSGSVSIFDGGTLDLANFAVTNVINFAGGSLINAGSLAGGVSVTGNVSASDINALAVSEVSLGSGATVDLSAVTKDIVVTGNATLQNLGSFTGKLAVAGALDLSSAGNRPSGATIELRAGGTLDFGSSTPFTGSVAYKGGAIQGAFAGTVNVAATNVALTDANIASGTVVVGTGASVDVSSFTGTVRLTGDGGVTAGLPAFSGTLELGAGSTLNLTTLGGSLDNATVTVDDGATMRGTGTVGDTTLASGGTLAPGNSPGSLTYSNLALQGGASIDFEIANTGGGLYPPVAGSDYDTLLVNGLLDLSGLSVGNTLTLNLISLIADGTAAGDLGDFDPAGTFAFDLISYGQISAYEGSISQYFTLDGSALTFNGAPVDMQYWNLVDTGTALQLQYAPIPEPSTYGLVLGGLALAGAAVRRRRAKRA